MSGADRSYLNRSPIGSAQLLLLFKKRFMDLKVTQKEDGVTLYEGQETAQDYSNYSMIPTWIMKHPDLQANDKLVYALIDTFNVNNKPFFGSNGFIAASLNMSVATVKRSIRRLEQAKLVFRKLGEHSRQGIAVVGHVRPGGGSQMTQGGVTDDLGVGHVRPTTKLYTKKDTKKITIISKDISKPSFGNSDINDLTLYFSEKLGASLDGSVKINRQYASNLIRKIKKDYPDKDPVQAIKVIIDLAIGDDFHSKNATGFKYLFYNAQKIIASYKQKKNILLKI